MRWRARERIKQCFSIKTNRIVPVWGIFGKKSYSFGDFYCLSTTHQNITSHVYFVTLFFLFAEEELKGYAIKRSLLLHLYGKRSR